MSPVYLGNVRRTKVMSVTIRDSCCHSYRGYVASGVSHAMHIMKAIPVVVQRVTVGCSEWFQANLTPQYQEWERRQLSLEGEVMVSLFRRLQIKVKPPLEI